MVEQDKLVREGGWREGRTPLLQIPRLMGSTLGFIAFGHVARAVALRVSISARWPSNTFMLAWVARSALDLGSRKLRAKPSLTVK